MYSYEELLRKRIMVSSYFNVNYNNYYVLQYSDFVIYIQLLHENNPNLLKQSLFLLIQQEATILYLADWPTYEIFF